MGFLRGCLILATQVLSSLAAELVSSDQEFSMYLAGALKVGREISTVATRRVDPAKCLWEEYQIQLTEPQLSAIPKGNYSFPVIHGFSYWISNFSERELKAVNPRGQGWKIHISATPESALRVAQLFFSNLERLPHPKSDYVFFKIIRGLPLMRFLWYLSPYIRSEATQAGKFIVIYPESLEHARQLIAVLDAVFDSALDSGDLDYDSFYPIEHDASVGNSGALFVRYGGFVRENLTQVSPRGKTIQSKKIIGPVRDDRLYPWPDFMNTALCWRGQPCPFPGMNFLWIDPHTSKKILWETRPGSWIELEGKKLVRGSVLTFLDGEGGDCKGKESSLSDQNTGCFTVVGRLVRQNAILDLYALFWQSDWVI